MHLRKFRLSTFGCVSLVGGLCLVLAFFGLERIDTFYIGKMDVSTTLITDVLISNAVIEKEVVVDRPWNPRSFSNDNWYRIAKPKADAYVILEEHGKMTKIFFSQRRHVAPWEERSSTKAEKEFRSTTDELFTDH